MIARLAAELDVTSVLVTHDIDGALGIADRLALLDSGRIQFEGTPADLRRSDLALVRAFLDRDQVTEDLAMVVGSRTDNPTVSV
jgi:ABC-type transporter Mla maintaining outer membrane lipid asymmetry ATPase subunit MlaF